MAMEALGRLADVSVGVAPSDFNSAASTGKYVALKRNSGVMVVFIHAKGTSGVGDNTLTLKESKDTSASGLKNLAVIGHYYQKANTGGLDGSEVWTKVDNTSAGLPQATIAEASGLGAGDGVIIAFHVFGTQLDDGFGYIRVDAAKASGSSTPILSSILYFPYDLEVQRTPANLKAANS